jgi:recombination protein RecR
MHYPSHLLQLIESMKKLPGVGSKSAERFAFEMLKWSPSSLKTLGNLIDTIPQKLLSCGECGALRGDEPCMFCKEERASSSILCILASSKDVFAIEATRTFEGLYHVLGGVISPLEGIGPDQLNFHKLQERIQKHHINEVIIALDSTVEGDATALYLKKYLSSLPVEISRLAFGIPMGSSFDYVDGGTLGRAFVDRSDF